MYSDQTDTSNYPESDYSFFSQSSMISDFGDAPLSSTRRSSFFRMSDIVGRPGCRGMPYNRVSDMEAKRHRWNYSTSHWSSDGPSILSSTRMSAAGPAAAMQVLREHDSCANDDVPTTKTNEPAAKSDGKISPSRRDTLPAFSLRRASRKSVSFGDVDEYFPVFSPESPKEQPAVDISQLPFNLSEYSDFLDSDRLATVLHKQGIDVTSPDHVYVFCRENSTSTDEDIEKTIISQYASETSDEKEDEDVKEAGMNVHKRPTCSRVGSSSSGTGSSHYSSCDSDHYTSALDASLHPRHLLLPVEEEVPFRAESDKNFKISSDFVLGDENVSPVQTEPQIGAEPEAEQHSPGGPDTQVFSEVNRPNNEEFEACNEPVGETATNGGVGQKMDHATEALKDDFDLTFTPSPFVTGRTRSRLSRCSLRTSRTPESLHLTSSLFEETLPTPVRIRRQTPRSQSTADFYSSPRAPCYTPFHSGSDTGGDSLPATCQDTQCSTLKAGSSVSNSQADTLILPRSIIESAAESQTLSDTVILEENQDSSVNAYERNLAEVILAMQGSGLAEDRDFLTDDLTSADEATSKKNVNDDRGVGKVDRLTKEDAWISEGFSSQPDSVHSSSSSSCFSPRGPSEDSDPPCTPGTGCTPRYSMSRLSSCRRPQHLANLSYTPGGRPLILDLEEPVVYLYTDVEQGHALIETHVPPTANTSLSSSMSTSCSEETIVYDWRSMQTNVVENSGKENQRPPVVQQKKETDAGKFPETEGMTDRELRLRLVELGESPGPISSRTRPTYMRKLCRLLQESNSQSPHQRKQLDQSQTGNACALDCFLSNLNCSW